MSPVQRIALQDCHREAVAGLFRESRLHGQPPLPEASAERMAGDFRDKLRLMHVFLAVLKGTADIRKRIMGALVVHAYSPYNFTDILVNPSHAHDESISRLLLGAAAESDLRLKIRDLGFLLGREEAESVLSHFNRGMVTQFTEYAPFRIDPELPHLGHANMAYFSAPLEAIRLLTDSQQRQLLDTLGVFYSSGVVQRQVRQPD